ncbi:UNKNOWN [Stylonychia lemnae]|uniref:Uncharacterized protein n=1 Tax=Stylonychia lemnae TaxID=5949 RepID=A0A078AGJ6_STYLE|nr:UNKNOWN [Stylonychia lemnae]|eukprot:CDW80946.1 UNKNOWN [Stylonychia lemnae]
MQKLHRPNLRTQRRCGLGDIIKQSDIYGEQFSLTFQGEQKFKTWPGALTSLSVIAIILAYFSFRTQIMIFKQDNKTSVTTQLVDITQFEKAFQATQDQNFINFINSDFGFDIAAGTRPKNIEMRNRTDYELETETCGTEGYNYTNKDEVVLKQVSIAQCVKDKSMLKMKGTLYGKNAQFLEIRVQPCIDPTKENNINSTICATFEEQAVWWKNVNLLVYPVNTYFDFSDFTNPVKYFIDDTIFFPIMPSLGKQSFIYVRQSFTNLNDEFFSFESGMNKSLYSIQRQKDVIMETSYRGITYVSVQVRLDSYQDTYNRQIYGLMDLLGDVGGVQTIFIVVGSLLTGMFAERLLYGKMMNQIYHAKIKQPKNQHKRNLFGTMKVPKTPHNSATSIQKSNQYRPMGFSEDEEKGSQLSTKQNSKTSDSPNKIKEILFISRRKIMNTILNRQVFQYSACDIMKEFLCCFNCRRMKSKKEIQRFRQQYLYQKAKKKIEQKFDALSLIKFMHQMQLLGPTLLDQNQHLLMHFQKKQLLDSDQSSEDTDLDDQTTINILNNGKNPFVKLMILGRINQRVREILSKKKLTHVDTKLLKGLFTRMRTDKDPPKGINDTFRPIHCQSQSKESNHQAGIVRKFKSFVLRNSVENPLFENREKLSVLESIEDFLEHNDIQEIGLNNPIISRENSEIRPPPKAASKRYSTRRGQASQFSDEEKKPQKIFSKRTQKANGLNTGADLRTQDATNLTYVPNTASRRLKETVEEQSIQDDFEMDGNYIQKYMAPSSRRKSPDKRQEKSKKSSKQDYNNDQDSSRVMILQKKLKMQDKKHKKGKESEKMPKLNFPSDSD